MLGLVCFFIFGSVSGDVYLRYPTPGNSRRSSPKILNGLVFYPPSPCDGFRINADLFATDSHDAGFVPNKKPPRGEAWRLMVNYWLCLAELKGSAAHDLTVDYDVNAIGANTERTRTQVVNVLATVDSEV